MLKNSLRNSKCFVLADGNDFLHGEIEIGDPRPTADCAWRIAQARSAEWTLGIGVVGQLKRARYRRSSRCVCVDPECGRAQSGWACPGSSKSKLYISSASALRSDRYWEAVLEARDSRNGPAIQNLPFALLVFGDGQLPKVADHKPMPCVEAETSERLHRSQVGPNGIFKARSVVDRLAEGVGQLNCKPPLSLFSSEACSEL